MLVCLGQLAGLWQFQGLPDKAHLPRRKLWLIQWMKCKGQDNTLHEPT